MFVSGKAGSLSRQTVIAKILLMNRCNTILTCSFTKTNTKIIPITWENMAKKTFKQLKF